MVGEGSSRLCVFLGVPTFFLSNMFLAIGGGGGGFGFLFCSCSLCGLPSFVIFSFC